jgi:hypothetical protein
MRWRFLLRVASCVGCGGDRVSLFLAGRICTIISCEKIHMIGFLRHEKNISTAPPQEEEHTRVSGTHGNEEWPKGAQSAPGKGSL